MPDIRAEYEDAKRKAEELTRERDRAAGARSEIVKAVREKFGVKTDQQARELQARLDREVRELEERFRRAKGELDVQWRDRLNGQ